MTDEEINFDQQRYTGISKRRQFAKMAIGTFVIPGWALASVVTWIAAYHAISGDDLARMLLFAWSLIGFVWSFLIVISGIAMYHTHRERVRERRRIAELERQWRERRAKEAA